MRTLLFAVMLAIAYAGSFIEPIWGILGYVGVYSVGPQRQWWAAPINALGLRYSLTLALVVAAGMFLNWGNLRYGRRFLCDHEKLILLFLGIVWLLVVVGPSTVGKYNYVDHPSIKLTKVVIFLLMLSHVVTNFKNTNRLMWGLILGTVVLGIQAWETPYSSFNKGRLSSVGGPDFAEANYFAAYMATMLWIIAGQFLRSGWQGKFLCAVAGAFTANAIVLTRSRGAVVGLVAGGIMALWIAPRQYRSKILLGMVLAGAGFLYLTDDRFLERSATIVASSEERDSSSQSRIYMAKAGIRMWMNNPLGVGAGNYYQSINPYAPLMRNMDAHNTYIRCLGELGIEGLVVFLLLIASAFRILREVSLRARELPDHEAEQMIFWCFGLKCALVTMCASCLTMSLTYVEFLWWMLILPVCLQRTLQNAEREAEAMAVDDSLGDEADDAEDTVGEPLYEV
jgi:putative inorganic carbon (HCO3(-)) transporter